MKVGVFDSGIGGLSVAEAIKSAMPELEVDFKYDKEHFPYSGKEPRDIFDFVVPIIEGQVKRGCKVVVVACNTVSTTLIKPLRAHFKVPLIALEPMIKPAALKTKTKIIAVCATPTTLASERYKDLKTDYASNLTVLEPDCSRWSYMIEHNEMEQATLEREINRVLSDGADVIVLGCTHYHWIEEDIKSLAEGRALILQPETAIISRLKQVLGQLP